MPPKKSSGAGPSAKTVEKQKQKIIEDKTFGLKNKNKSKKVQKQVQQITQQVQQRGTPGGGRPAEDPHVREKRKKEEEAARLLELALLGQTVQPPQKVAPGVDPKTVLCQYFKAGNCTKGTKCKFSHDLNVGRKVEKKDLYSDSREEDTMDKWDQKKLEEVIEKKSVGKKVQSEIICKFFLEAVERSQYGWFWECPNGEACHYRHALPPGFVLKKDKKKEEDETISLEEFLETERHKITGTLTPITLETFNAWKVAKREQKVKELEEEDRKKKEAAKAGKLVGMSGRDLFTYRPELFVDDEEAGDADMYVQRAEEENEDEEQEFKPLYDDDGKDVTDLEEEPTVVDASLFDADALGDVDDEEEDDNTAENTGEGEEEEEEDEEEDEDDGDGASSSSAHASSS